MRTVATAPRACVARSRRVVAPRCQSVGPARLAEVAAGRAAFGGLLATSIVGNLTGTSIVQQYLAEEPYVWAFAVAVVAGTVAKGVCEKDARLELTAGRSSMAVLSLLTALELALLR